MSCQNLAIYLGGYSVSSSAWLILSGTPLCYGRQTWLANSHIIATVIWSASSLLPRSFFYWRDLQRFRVPKKQRVRHKWQWRLHALRHYKYSSNVIRETITQTLLLPLARHLIFKDLYTVSALKTFQSSSVGLIIEYAIMFWQLLTYPPPVPKCNLLSTLFDIQKRTYHQAENHLSCPYKL